MKGDFIIKFLEEIVSTVEEFNRSVSHLSCKGFRPSSFTSSRYDNVKYYKGFKNLERRGFIRLVSNDYYQFTNTGKTWLKKSTLKYFRLRYKKWDKKWRIIVFDIPEELRKERARFRTRLKWLGCVMLQESVFVFPYPCEKELAEYCSKLKISDYVNFLEADSLGYLDGEIRKSFKL